MTTKSAVDEDDDANPFCVMQSPTSKARVPGPVQRKQVTDNRFGKKSLGKELPSCEKLFKRGIAKRMLQQQCVQQRQQCHFRAGTTRTL